MGTRRRASGGADPRPPRPGGQEAATGPGYIHLVPRPRGPIGDVAGVGWGGAAEPGGEVAGEKLLLVRASGETIGLLEPAGGTKNKRNKSVPPSPLLSRPSVVPRACFSLPAQGWLPAIPRAPCPSPGPPSPCLLPTSWAIPTHFSPLHHLPLAFVSFPPAPPPSPPLPSPSSLLGALAGLLLTKEPLDLRHPFCPALFREKEASREGPGPLKGSCPLEGRHRGEGKAGRGEARAVAEEAICPRIDSAPSLLSLLMGSGTGPSRQ